MIYLVTKAAHLVSLFIWIGGMVAVAVALRYPQGVYLKQVRAYDQKITSPAMVSAWVFGILLGIQGGWFQQSWLAFKILLVLALSAIHGLLAGRLRRATSGEAQPDNLESWVLPAGLTLVTVIVLLVTLKP